MSLLSKIMWRSNELKKTSVASILSYMGLRQAVWTERDFVKLAKEGYTINPIVNAAVQRRAEAVASIPVIARVNGDEVDDHPALQLLSRPNPEMTKMEFVESLHSSLIMGGNAYIERVGVRAVREMWNLRTDRMKILTGRNGWPSAYEYEVAGRTKTWPVGASILDSEVLHFRDYNPLSDDYGLGDMEPAAYAIDVHNESTRWVKALLDNAARPSGAFVHTPSEANGSALGEEQFQNLKKELEETYAGARGSGKPMLLEGGLSWQEMGVSPREMDFLMTRQQMSREIALAFKTPPMVLGIPGDNTYSNYKEANAAFYRTTVIPDAIRVYARIGQWLGRAMGEEGLTLTPDLDEIPALAEERAAVWEKLEGASFLSEEEKREAAGYDRKVPEGDTVRGLTARTVDSTPPETRNDP